MSRRSFKCSCGKNRDTDRDMDRYSDDTESIFSDDSACDKRSDNRSDKQYDKHCDKHKKEEKPKRECYCSGKEDSKKCNDCGGKIKKSEKKDSCKCKYENIHSENNEKCENRCYKPDKFIVIKM